MWYLRPGRLLDVFIRSVFAGLRRAAVREGIADAQCGAITAIQRFGSALNANVHFHSLVLDGVFSRPAPGAAPVFHPLPAPTDEEIVQILEQIHERVTHLLRRCGRLPEDPSPTDPVAAQMPLLAGYAAAAIQERIATGPGRPSCAPAAHRRRGGGRGEAPVRPPGGVLAPRQRRPARARPEQLEHLCPAPASGAGAIDGELRGACTSSPTPARQEFTFSPPGTTFEREEWSVSAQSVTHLQVVIRPDKGTVPSRATLTSLTIR